MLAIEFTNNYHDLSTETGFQFKFFCERCGDGYLSSFDTNEIGVLAAVLRGAGRIFGGLAGRISYGTYDMQQAVGGVAHDKALSRAVGEVSLLFRKCRRCGDWMCVQSCWNGDKKMCKRCAPIAEEEETSVRAEEARGQAASDVRLEESERLEGKAREVEAVCPDCKAATMGKKFCPGCGRKVEGSAGQFCGACGAKLTPGARFCGDCGAKSE